MPNPKKSFVTKFSYLNFRSGFLIVMFFAYFLIPNKSELRDIVDFASGLTAIFFFFIYKEEKEKKKKKKKKKKKRK